MDSLETRQQEILVCASRQSPVRGPRTRAGMGVVLVSVRHCRLIADPVDLSYVVAEFVIKPGLAKS